MRWPVLPWRVAGSGQYRGAGTGPFPSLLAPFEFSGGPFTFRPTDFDKLCGTSKSHDPHGVEAVRPIEQRL
jgi:hypothetical protein